jgi:IclR family acetate operon transcriptional repressor
MMMSDEQMAISANGNGNGAAGYQTRAVVRALQILDAFTHESAVLTVKDLHIALNLPKPTVSRLASVLAEDGLLSRTDDGYQLGPKTYQLGSLFARRYQVAEACRPALEAMAQRSMQTCCLGVLSGRDIVYLVVTTPPRAVHHVVEPGSSGFAHATALGKVILATMTSAALDRMLGTGVLPTRTEHTISSRGGLDKELEGVRKRGYAVDREETDPGLTCVGIAVDLPGFPSVAISVSGPASEYTASSEKRFVPILRETARGLESSVGRAVIHGADAAAAALGGSFTATATRAGKSRGAEPRRRLRA